MTTLWASHGCLSSTAISNLDISGSTMVADTPNVATSTGSAANLTVRLARGDGVPIADANVLVGAVGCTASQSSATTDANGVVQATLGCLNPGEYLVTADLLLFDGAQALAPTVSLLAYTAVDGASAVSPGTALNMEATARLPSGLVDLTYKGTVHLTSSDPLAQLPADYTFTSIDYGNKIWPAGVLLYTLGTQTVTAADAATGVVLGEQTFNVEGGNAASLVLTVSSAQVAGTSFDVGVQVIDAQGNPALRYRGTVQLSSSDPNAILPGSIGFSAADAAQVSFAGVQLQTAGAQSLWVVDTMQTSLSSGAVYVAVQPGAGETLQLSLPVNTFAGQSMQGQLRVVDGYGNVSPNFSGQVHFVSDDPLAVLPPDASVNAADTSTERFGGFVLATAGNGSVTVSDVNHGLRSATSVTNVAPINANDLQLTLGPACANGCNANTPSDVTMTAYDMYGNIATSYRGTVLFSSNDPLAVLAGSYTFSAADRGSRNLPNAVTFYTAGPDAVAVTDVATVNLTASSATVQVSAGPATRLTLGTPAIIDACSPINLRVAAYDAYDNIATSYTGTVHFSVNPSSAVLPSNYTFTGTDAGQHTFAGQTTFNLMQTCLLTVQDANQLSQTVSVNVLGGLPTSFDLVAFNNDYKAQQGIPAPAIALQINDACGNTTNNYGGTVRVVSSDPQATFLTPTATFVQGHGGVWTPNPTFQALGTQTLTFIDTTGVIPSGTVTLDVYRPCAAAYGNSMGSAGVAGVAIGGTGAKSLSPSLGITSNFQPVLAWSDNRNGPFAILVEQFNGSAWVGVAGSTPSGGVSGQDSNDTLVPALAIGPGDVASVAWVSTAEGGGTSSAIFFASDANSSWQGNANSTQLPGVTGSAADYVDGVRLAVDGNDVPYVAWRDKQTSTVHVRTSTGTSWASLGSDPNTVGSDSETSAGALSLALDSNGMPYLAWEATVSSIPQIYLSYWNGAAWVGLAGSNAGEGISSSTCGAKWPSLALDGNNVPYVAYSACDSGRSQVYVVSYQSGWVGVAGSNAGTGLSHSSGQATQPALALASTGNPAVVWTDTGYGSPAIYLAVYNGSAWTFPNNSAAHSGISNYVGSSIGSPTLVMGQSDVPLIAFVANAGITYFCAWE